MLGSASLSATSREIDGSAHLFGRSSALSFSAGRFILIGSFISAHALPSPLPTALQPACFFVKDDVEPMWSNNISKKTSKEIGMPTRRFELAQLLVSGCAVVFGLIELAQAQPGYVPPPTPLPPPVLNPSNPGTVPQPSYRPITPTTPSTVPSVDATPPAARSEQSSEMRTVHHYHHHRGYYAGAGPSLGSFDCSYFSWCVRISLPYAYYRPYGWYRY